MQLLGCHNYFIYIVTNKNRTVLYTGVTNDLKTRLFQHEMNSKPYTNRSFAGHYNAYHLLYFERFEFIEHAIDREKQIKGWTRAKKIALISTLNPGMIALNDQIE